MQRYFRNVKYLNLSKKGISIVKTVWIEEGSYGDCLIYSGLKPAFLLALITNTSGNFIAEFNYYCKKYNLNVYAFLDKILKAKTQYSIKPRTKNGVCFFIKDTGTQSPCDIEFIDFDPIWYSLSKDDLKKIIPQL